MRKHTAQWKRKCSRNYLQATNTNSEDQLDPLVFSGIYCPPKHNNKKEHYEEFFSMLGNNSIAGGGYNAKHSTWGLD